MQHGNENTDVVVIEQLNDLQDELVKFIRRDLQTKINLLETKLTNLIDGANKVFYGRVFEKYAI